MPNYPYVSGQGALVATFTQLRKGFPAKVDAGYLQRFGIAPANESYVISILKFLSLIGADGDKIVDNTHFFYGDEESFKGGLESALRTAYSQLFSEMGDDALVADKSSLTNWFRTADRTSDLVGGRQAATFRALAALAGHGEPPAARAARGAKKAEAAPGATKKTTAKKASARKAAETRATTVEMAAHVVATTARAEARS